MKTALSDGLSLICLASPQTGARAPPARPRRSPKRERHESSFLGEFGSWAAPPTPDPSTRYGRHTTADRRLSGRKKTARKQAHTQQAVEPPPPPGHLGWRPGVPASRWDPQLHRCCAAERARTKARASCDGDVKQPGGPSTHTHTSTCTLIVRGFGVCETSSEHSCSVRRRPARYTMGVQRPRGRRAEREEGQEK